MSKDHSEFRRRRRAHAQGKKAAGQTPEKKDYSDFMEQCMQEVQDIGEAEDENEAEQICQVLWEDEQDVFDWP